MKQELLEHLIRMCVREVIEQVQEEDEKDTKPEEPKDDGETKGAPAPPADGQGTADQPEIPKDKPTEPMGDLDKKDEKPAAPSDEPEVPAPTDLKGVILVNPRDKSDLKKVPLKATADDATLERNLHRLAATLAGSHVKIAISTQRMVKDVLKNPSGATYLYLGKYDPSSDEIFLMADKSLQIAKDSSISPAELSGTPVAQVAPTDFHAMTATPDDFANRMQYGAQKPTYAVNEDFKRAVKKMVREILDRK